MPPAPAASPAPPPAGGIDLRVPQWPVRNQGERDTCVAFASAACAERVSFDGSAAGGPTALSEQFLYAVIKTQTDDTLVDYNKEATHLQYARDALQNYGICPDSIWPYVPARLSDISQIGGGNPWAAAIAAAAANKCPPREYQSAGNAGGWAAKVLAAMQGGRPVAITLPMFADAERKAINTWVTASAVQYGRVINPPPTSQSQVDAHAVCVVGFVPIADSTEPLGYFIFRNSWGTAWAVDAPSPGNSYAPEPGYGDVSASYVDQFLLEMLEL